MDRKERWDESLPITDHFLDLVMEAVGAEKGAPRGRALLFVAHPVPWLHGTKTLGSTCYVKCIYIIRIIIRIDIID